MTISFEVNNVQLYPRPNASQELRLEKRKKKHKNMQIIYSARPLRMAEAFNLGLVHIRTRHAFLMHNHLFVTPGWLSNLIEQAKSREGVICPYVSPMDTAPFPMLHAFLATKQLLDGIGLFDESVGTPLLGADLENRLKAIGVPMHRDPYTLLEYQTSALPKKGADSKFFEHQWDDPHAHQTLAYLKQKWGSAPEELKYLEWLTKKKASAKRKPVFALSAWSLPLASAKLIQVLHRA